MGSWGAVLRPVSVHKLSLISAVNLKSKRGPSGAGKARGHGRDFGA